MKEYGSELVEVIDNGAGVEEENFQALSKWFIFITSGYAKIYY
jgi:DNA mismatch repair ATPase MutL